MKYWVVFLALAGCASEDVIDMGGGRFSTTASSARSVASARIDAQEQATDYCDHLHKKAVIETFDDKTHGGPALQPVSSVVFHCE